MNVRRRHAFTLVEVIVAMTILAFIGTLSFSTIMGALQTRDILEAEDAVNQSARVAMDQIRRELSLAYLTPSTGAINTYRTVFVGQDSNPDRLWFNSLSHQRLYRDTRECDQTEITLWTEEDPHDDDAKVLLHREAPRIDQEPDIDELVGEQAFIGIGEMRAQFDRAGGRIDLVVDGYERSRGYLVAVFAIPGFDHQLLLFFTENQRQLVLRDREDRRRRVGERRRACGIAKN